MTEYYIPIHGAELASAWVILILAGVIWATAPTRRTIEIARIIASFSTVLWLMIWTFRWAVKQWVASGDIPVPH